MRKINAKIEEQNDKENNEFQKKEKGFKNAIQKGDLVLIPHPNKAGNQLEPEYRKNVYKVLDKKEENSN